MDYFQDFYHRVFNFHEHQYFDITGEYTGLTSRALASPCGKIRIPINESKYAGGADQVDQIQEFIQQYRGEGIQHVALRTENIFDTWDRLHAKRVKFMTPPPLTYYEMLEERLPGHGVDIEQLQKRGILLDGAQGRYLLQIFTETLIGPIFFEIIERRGRRWFRAGQLPRVVREHGAGSAETRRSERRARSCGREVLAPQEAGRASYTPMPLLTHFLTIKSPLVILL